MRRSDTACCLAPLAATILGLTGCQEPTAPSAAKPDATADQMVQIFLDFKLPDIGDVWTFRTPQLWHIATEEGNRFLQLEPQPDRPMMPGAWRPQEYALYNAHQFRSFSLACWVRIDQDTAVARRDACIIFGRQDPTHLYYAHLAGLTDETHNALLRVDGDTRKALLPPDQRPPPAITDTAWHKVDVLRDADTGLIEVHVDGQLTFRAIDKTYEWGHVGFGSVNDYASFAGLRIKGVARSASPPVTEAARQSSPRM